MVTTDDVLPRASVSADAVRSIAAQVWESLFDAEAVQVAGVAGEDFGPDPLTFSVDVYGPWDGTVSLTCDAAVGEEMTRRMLALPASDDIDPLDLEDALGEVVNVIGGNVKSLVDGSTLGLPRLGGVSPDPDTALAVLYIEWGATSAVRVSVHDRKDNQPEFDTAEDPQREEHS
jgi:chemotaxis protein CheX